MIALPRYVSAFKDRHGAVRFRYRRRGRDFYIRSTPGTPEFEEEYAVCMGAPRPESKPEPPYREPSGLVFQLDMVVNCRGLDATGPYVYFVEAPVGLIKIGFSKSLRERFKKLQTCSPLPLGMLSLRRGCYADEIELHKRFAGDRVRGEWFSATDEIRACARAENALDCLPF